jgi:hypothetical protein
MKTEQRQYPRYRLQEVEFHIYSHGDRITGRLINIGKGGLAFEFSPGPEQTAEGRAIDLLESGPDLLYIPGIDVRRIYDIRVLAEGRTFTGAESRLCGVQFIDLTDDQARKLTELIDRHGVKLRTIP